MTDHYTLTFEPTIVNLEKELLWVKALGVSVQSKQSFLGTAIVIATPEQVKAIEEHDNVKSITPFKSDLH